MSTRNRRDVLCMSYDVYFTEINYIIIIIIMTANSKCEGAREKCGVFDTSAVLGESMKRLKRLSELV